MTETETTRIALDQSACIRSQSNIGETVFHNLCEGTTSVVPWGGVDWFAAIAVAGLLLTMTGAFVALAWLIISTVVRDY